MKIQDTSVAIATYNGESFIRQQLFSILSQTIRPREVILSDDGSTDKTIEIADQILKEDGIEYKIISGPKRLGFANNFLRALKNCTSSFVFISDQDDIWLPHKIERMLLEAQKNPRILLLMHDALIGDEILRVEHYSLINKTNLSDRLYSYGFTMLVSNLIIKELPSSYLPAGHDLFINHVANILDAKKVIREPLAIYRRHPQAFTINNTQLPFGGPLKWFIYSKSMHKKSILSYRSILNTVNLVISNNSGLDVPLKNIMLYEKLLDEEKLRYSCRKIKTSFRIWNIIALIIFGRVSLIKGIKDIFSLTAQ